MFQIGGDLHVLAAIDRADVLHARYFLGKAHAAGALDAAGHRRLDDGAHVFLGHGPLVLVKAGVAASIGKRSEEHTSELQSLMRISYAVFCVEKNNTQHEMYEEQ